jgi:hypothetical protein
MDEAAYSRSVLATNSIFGAMPSFGTPAPVFIQDQLTWWSDANVNASASSLLNYSFRHETTRSSRTGFLIRPGFASNAGGGFDAGQGNPFRND